MAPDILVNESSSDVTVNEGANVTLKCSAVGYPTPTITWRREDNQPIVGQSKNLASVADHAMTAFLFRLPSVDPRWR